MATSTSQRLSTSPMQVRSGGARSGVGRAIAAEDESLQKGADADHCEHHQLPSFLEEHGESAEQAELGGSGGGPAHDERGQSVLGQLVTLLVLRVALAGLVIEFREQL